MKRKSSLRVPSSLVVARSARAHGQIRVMRYGGEQQQGSLKGGRRTVLLLLNRHGGPALLLVSVARAVVEVHSRATQSEPSAAALLSMNACAERTKR